MSPTSANDTIRIVLEGLRYVEINEPASARNSKAMKIACGELLANSCVGPVI